MCQFVPLRLSYSSILLDWAAVNKGLTCFCTVLVLCSGKPFDWFIAELPEVGSGFLCCSLIIAIVRIVLFKRLECSPMFISSYYQSSALLSTLKGL